MALVFLILVVLFCVILGFIVLVQNPKGGGLAANIGGVGNQFMGVKQTTDVLEKGTWISAGIVGLLCLFSVAFIPTTSSKQNLLDKINAKPTTTNTAPAPTQQPVNQTAPAAPVQKQK